MYLSATVFTLFEPITAKWHLFREYPFLTPSFEGNLGAAHSKDFVILACTVLIQITSVTDGRQTPRRWQRRVKHSAFARKNVIISTGWAKMAQNFYMPITSSNINRFSNFSYCQNQQKICSNVSAKDPTTRYSCRYTTLWNVTQAGDDYDQLHDQRWFSLTCGLLKSRRLCCLGGPFNRWFINVDNSRQLISWSTEWAKLSQRLADRAIGQWRRRLECVVRQASRRTH